MINVKKEEELLRMKNHMVLQTKGLKYHVVRERMEVEEDSRTH